MRVLVTGGAGLLGRALLASAPTGVELHATQHRSPVVADGVIVHELDLADVESTASLVESVAPTAVVHTAYRKEDGERDIVEATAAIAVGCARAVTSLVHLSSDVVFGGEAAPYGEEATLDPVMDYGRHKAEAEQAVRATVPDACVVRTSLLVQQDPLDATSRWIADAIGRGETPRLYTDELRCPTAPLDLAFVLWELLGLPAERRAGFWHVAGAEAVSRYTLGLLVADHLGLPARFEPASNREHPTPRPRDLRLRTTRADAELRSRPRPVSAVLAGPPERANG